MKFLSGAFAKNAKYILLALVVGTAFWLHTSTVKKVQKQNTELLQKLEITVRDRDTAIQNFSTAQSAAEQNKKVAEELLAENKKLDIALIDMSKKVSTFRAFSTTQSVKIAVSTTADDGPIAKVLHDVISAIQLRDEGEKTK